MRLAYVIGSLWLLLAVGTVSASTFVVNTSADSHDAVPGDGLANKNADADSVVCSLRAAIEEANALAGPDTILVPFEIGPIMLSLGTLTVRDNGTVISGVGGRAVVDGISNPINHATLVIDSDSNSVTGLHLRRAHGDALVIFGASNAIGGEAPDNGLIFTANGLDNLSAAAVRISGTAARWNVVAGNYIGLTANGVTPDGNRHGVVIENGAGGNLIGGLTDEACNVISGNSGYGVVLTGGVAENSVTGNWIGPDSTGNEGPGNGRGGILVSTGAHDNLLGGDDLTLGNVVSGNDGHGITLTGDGVYTNRIDGNMVGTTANGADPLGNLGDGILLADGTHDNLIGGTQAESGNLISANGGHGLRITGVGTDRTTVTANWIGLARNGFAGMGNGWSIEGDGILIDSGASHNTIGDSTPTLRNVIAASHRFGVHLQGSGTAHNAVMGNYIGVNFTGTSSVGNAAGVAISDGAQSNIIGGTSRASGNLISGNRGADFPYGAGVLIFGEGTDFNRVSANVIGLDVTGLLPRRNGSSGIIIGSGAQYNVIGGDSSAEGNVISGNGVDEAIDGRAAGVHIFGTSTSYNRTSGNLIGYDPNAAVIIGNRGHGIGLYSGANHNVIGGDDVTQMNQIVGNDGAGVFVSGPETRSNLVRRNVHWANDGLGIDLRDSAQGNIQPPEITRVDQLLAYGPRYVAGRNAPPGAQVDIYQVAEPDPSGSGEADLYLATAVADNAGRFELYLPSGPPVPIILTAVAVAADSNSSEFSVNGYSLDAVAVEDLPGLLPQEFSLFQNFPNPFNGSTSLSFVLPSRAHVDLSVFNILGQSVRTLVNRVLPSGEHSFSWDARDEGGTEVSSGVYLYRLETSEGTLTRKMVFIK
ncbi:MAG: FlgD immunoglobulin-like domain containing protein [Candidatus Zixiibacteriota bacterium]